MTLHDTAPRPPVGDPVPARAPGYWRWGLPVVIAAAAAAVLWSVSTATVWLSGYFVVICSIASVGAGFGIVFELDRRTPAPTSVSVVARLPGRRRLVGLFVIGAVLGAIPSMATGPLTFPLMRYVILIYGMMIPAVLVLLSRHEQRSGRALLEAVSLATGFHSAMWILPVLAANLVPSSVLEFVVGLLSTWLTVAGFCVLVRIIGLWGIRAWGRTVVLQTGTLCWTCGYDLTGNTSGVCPECGTKIEAVKHR